MIELNSAERKKFRGLAQRLKPAVHLGRSGLTDTVVNELEIALKRDQLVKVRLHLDSREDRTKMLDEITARTGAALCGTIGQTASFYRPRPEGQETEEG